MRRFTSISWWKCTFMISRFLLQNVLQRIKDESSELSRWKTSERERKIKCVSLQLKQTEFQQFDFWLLKRSSYSHVYVTISDFQCDLWICVLGCRILDAVINPALRCLHRHRYIRKAALLRGRRHDGGPSSALQRGPGRPSGGHLPEARPAPSRAPTATSSSEGIPGSCSCLQIWDQQASCDDCIPGARLLLPHTAAFVPALGLSGPSAVQHGPEPQQPHAAGAPLRPGRRSDGDHAAPGAEDSWIAGRHTGTPRKHTRISWRDSRTPRGDSRITRGDSRVSRRVTGASGGPWTEGTWAQLWPPDSLSPAGSEHRRLDLDSPRRSLTVSEEPWSRSSAKSRLPVYMLQCLQH